MNGSADVGEIMALPFSLATLQPSGIAFPIAQHGSTPQVSRKAPSTPVVHDFRLTGALSRMYPMNRERTRFMSVPSRRGAAHWQISSTGDRRSAGDAMAGKSSINSRADL